jgi:hypothetical protein
MFTAFCTQKAFLPLRQRDCDSIKKKSLYTLHCTASKEALEFAWNNSKYEIRLTFKKKVTIRRKVVFECEMMMNLQQTQKTVSEQNILM